MKRILVINNDFETMCLLKAWLEIKGYEAMFTGNQDAVVQIIKEFKPHLVLVDEMQNEVVENLKNEDNNAPTLLLMTGYTSRQAAAKLPADGIIEKPFVLPLLEKKIKRLIDDNFDSVSNQSVMENKPIYT